MANGVPVVALKVAGIEDYLTDERTGLIARSRRDTHVAAVIDRVIRDRRLARRLAASARVMVRRRFLWTRTLADIGTVYHELRGERR